jgi:signal transduction histidine kinase
MQDRAILQDVAMAMAQPGWRAAAVATVIVMLGLLIGSTYHMKFTGMRAKPQRPSAVSGVRTPVVPGEQPAARLVNSRLHYVDFQEALGLLHLTLESLNARAAILDCCGNVIEANESWRSFMREFLRPAQLVNPKVLTAEKLQLPPDQPASEFILAAVSSVVDGAREKYKAPYRSQERGTEKAYEVSVTRIEAHGTIHILVSHEDVTDVRDAAVTIRELSKHVAEIEEEERQRIAGELHDVTGQHLIAISLNLMNLRREMKVSNRIERLIDDIERSTEDAQREIRLLSYLLYPPQLEHDGAKETIEHYVDGFARRAGLQIRRSVGREMDGLPLELQRSVLRIIQEAMANVHRHAQATSVTLKVTTDRNTLYMEVRDDGRGIPQTERGSASPVSGVGIPGMKARVGQFNGVFRIESSNKGTLVQVRIPIANAEAASDRLTERARVLH